jgi:hypothetical protein
MYINSLQKNIQGPCGNSTYECLSPLNESQSKFISQWNDEQLIVGQVYSRINGCFGKVRKRIFVQNSFEVLVILIRFFEVIFIFVIHMIFSNQFLLKL